MNWLQSNYESPKNSQESINMLIKSMDLNSMSEEDDNIYELYHIKPSPLNGDKEYCLMTSTININSNDNPLVTWTNEY